jgi:UDP-N-acetylmuramate--alanine ligase
VVEGRPPQPAPEQRPLFPSASSAAPPGVNGLGRGRRVHLIGAGGAGMSAIATVLLAMGHRVSGSDLVDSVPLHRLASLGAVVSVGHDASRIGDAEIVAVSTAIAKDNAEVVEAHRRGLPVWRRSDLLAAICAERRTIAVAGTHGKTSTSSMLALILRDAGLHPSYVIGGDLMGIGPGAAWDPDGEWLVVEADESDGTFLQLGAPAVVVTSVEPDHLDFYGHETALRQAFADFVDQATGPKVLCADDAGASSLAARPASRSSVVTYGTCDDAAVRIEDVSLGRADARFWIQHQGERRGPFHVEAPGLLYVRNAVAALTMAHSIGIDWGQAGAGLAAYHGVARRFERRGERDGVTFVDDYGHLPTEVADTLRAAAAGGWSRLVVVFQPHRYSRTATMWRDFADAFIGADVVLITDVYPAGEPPRAGVTGRLVVDAVRRAHPRDDVRYVPTLDDAESELRGLLEAGDLCLTLGAGDLTTLPERFLRRPEADG